MPSWMPALKVVSAASGLLFTALYVGLALRKVPRRVDLGNTIKALTAGIGIPIALCMALTPVWPDPLLAYLGSNLDKAMLVGGVVLAFVSVQTIAKIIREPVPGRGDEG